jgi:hypothetical protein
MLSVDVAKGGKPLSQRFIARSLRTKKRTFVIRGQSPNRRCSGWCGSFATRTTSGRREHLTGPLLSSWSILSEFTLWLSVPRRTVCGNGAIQVTKPVTRDRRERGYVRGRLPFKSGFMPIAATVKFLLLVTAPWRVR